jgi:hypothetical protein
LIWKEKKIAKKNQIKPEDRVKAIAGMDVKITVHANIELLLPYDREMVIDVRRAEEIIDIDVDTRKNDSYDAFAHEKISVYN